MSIADSIKIFADQPASAAPQRPAPVRATESRQLSAQPVLRLVVNAPVAKPVEIAPAIETNIITIIESPAALGETLEAAFRRKEQELGNLFAQLSVVESRALHRRLANPRAGDQLAATFGRMVAARRQRLLDFLADVRRREALAIARGR